MSYWICTNCGYLLNAAAPPQKCPSCGSLCHFNDVTCYRPECGGEENVDPWLVGDKVKKMPGRYPEKHEPGT